jgi:hypothetical protein
MHTLEPCHEDEWGSRGMDLHILNFSTRQRWVVTFKLLYAQGRSPEYLLDVVGFEHGVEKR